MRPTVDWIGALYARTMPRPTFTRATTPIAAGEPMAGITKNGTTNVPTMAPTVFAASSRPALVATLPSRPDTRADEAGKLRPITIVAGTTTITKRHPSMPTGPEVELDGSRQDDGGAGEG